jgi:hypothetical protein
MAMSERLAASIRLAEKQALTVLSIEGLGIATRCRMPKDLIEGCFCLFTYLL